VTANEAELKKLMLAGLDGDAVSYRGLLDRLSRVLRAYFRTRLTRIGRELTEAEDVMQDALMAIHTRRHTYDRDKMLLPWVFAIARYKLVDHLRRTRAGMANIPLDDVEALALHEEASSIESSHDLHNLLRELPDGMRNAIQSVKLDGLSVAETANRLGMSESAVKVNVHRGLKRLATHIAKGTTREDR
jgi:RNA polymerase sigma-70 factor (ECF subfamily)